MEDPVVNPELQAAVEALLFASDDPLPLARLAEVLALDPPEAQAAVDAVRSACEAPGRGLALVEVAGGLRLVTRPELAPVLLSLQRLRLKSRLSRAAVETLAIIAYRQPVTRPEIEDIRGVDCGAVVKALLERRLIKIMGKKEEPGRPMLYGTTREFLEFFALKDLASLPTLREFHELSEEHRDIVEKETGAPAEPASIQGLVADLSDPNLRAAMQSKLAEGDAALEELERAMEEAEQKTRAAEAALKPPGAEEEPPGEGTPPAV
jgi:segregation and condensation protein B